MNTCESKTGSMNLKLVIKLKRLINLKFGTLQLYLDSKSIRIQKVDHECFLELDLEFIHQPDVKQMIRVKSLKVGVIDLMNGYHFGVQKLLSSLALPGKRLVIVYQFKKC